MLGVRGAGGVLNLSEFGCAVYLGGIWWEDRIHRVAD